MLKGGLTGSSFSWTPSASLSAGLYALEIVDSTGPNYSVQFPISGSTSTTSVLSRTSVVTQLITPSPLATLSTLEFSSSSTSPTPTSSSDETEASAPTTLSTARASQTLAPTETESDTFEETTLRRTTSKYSPKTSEIILTPQVLDLNSPGQAAALHPVQARLIRLILQQKATKSLLPQFPQFPV